MDRLLMQALSIRLKYLRSREALAAVLLPAVIVWRWSNTEGEIAWTLRLAALAMLALILMQGTLYWHLKLRSLENQAPLPTYFRRLFSAFKWANLALIGGILAALRLSDDGSLSDAVVGWTLGLLAGAMLEQINYFYYQLMYDTRAAFAYVMRNKRLRKAALAVDMERCEVAAARGTPMTLNGIP
jgi:hypothetical protein